MKKHPILYITVLLSFFLFVACDDEIDELDPFVQVDQNTFFDSPAAFQNGINGGYAQLVNYYSEPGSGLQGIPDILSDNVILVQNGRTSNSDYFNYRFVPSTAGAIPFYFNEAYEAVNAANLIIEQIDNLPNGAEKDNILAQALAIRSMAHFDLARIYGQVPTQSPDANSSLGITYIKVEDGDTGDSFALPARETVENNYVEIIEDLERAGQLISEDNGEGKFNKNAVFGLLSRIYLYNGEYQKAIDASNEVSTNLAAATELPDVYTDVSEAGIVFELSINSTTEIGAGGANDFGNNVGVLYSQSNATATISEYAIDFDFWNSINPDTDVRADVIQFEGTNQGVKHNAIKKFLGEEGQVNGRVDIKVIRAAEVLLNKAEAEFELGLETEALATLNILREARFLPIENRDEDPSNDITVNFVAGTETGQNLEDSIQFERRVELSFEGHRFFDLKRRGEAIERSNKGDVIDGTGTPPEVLTLEPGNFRFQLPIPIDEINANPNFQQNDGY